MNFSDSQHSEDISKDVPMVDMNSNKNNTISSSSHISGEGSENPLSSSSSSSASSSNNPNPNSASSMNLDEDVDHTSSKISSAGDFGEPIHPMRRKSTIILTDEPEQQHQESAQRGDQGQDQQHQQDQKLTDGNSNENDNMNVDYRNNEEDEGTQSRNSTQQDQQSSEHPELIPVELSWVQGGSRVFVTGSFTGWRKMIALNGPFTDGSFNVKLSLPAGTHRFRFIVDNELRFSDFLPTATDQMGNFVNYLEILPHAPQIDDLNATLDKTNLNNEERKLSKFDRNDKSTKSISTIDRLTNDDDDMGDGYSRYHDDEENLQPCEKQYLQDIPPIFTDPKVMEQYYLTLDNNQQNNNNNQQWLIPPQLPPHLESVILNNFSNDKDNNAGSLPIPNHVVLNHLATTSIKHNTLAVASVVRYQRKYATQILYAPLQ